MDVNTRRDIRYPIAFWSIAARFATAGWTMGPLASPLVSTSQINHMGLRPVPHLLFICWIPQGSPWGLRRKTPSLLDPDMTSMSILPRMSCGWAGMSPGEIAHHVAGPLALKDHPKHQGPWFRTSLQRPKSTPHKMPHQVHAEWLSWPWLVLTRASERRRDPHANTSQVPCLLSRP
jgi:hypothetical protein